MSLASLSMESSSSLSFMIAVWIMTDGVSYQSSIFFAVWGKEDATANPLRKNYCFTYSFLGFITPFFSIDNYFLAFGDPAGPKIMSSTWFALQVKLTGLPIADVPFCFAVTAIFKVIAEKYILWNNSQGIRPLWGYSCAIGQKYKQRLIRVDISSASQLKLTF